MKHIEYRTISFGADPEFFFQTKGGAVIGAEKVLPKEGVQEFIEQYMYDQYGNLVLDDNGRPTTRMVAKNNGHKYLIIDGVQAEFNVLPNTCRQSFSTNLAICFRKTAEQIHGKDIVASFAQTVEVDKEEMQSLSRDAQQFGCAPSKNAYGRTEVTVKDASKYLSRSAGGHVHIGHAGDGTVERTLKNTDITVPILDIIVGNTCVLLDRDKGNVERRKNYGRAGEYRVPKHGLEYRTLSNFWLRSYQTMSFVLALVRFAVCVAGDEAVSKELLSLVDIEQVAKAINDNDLALAQANFDKVKDFILSIGVKGGSTNENWFPLQGVRMPQFEFFAQKGLNHWFKEDIMKHWVEHQYRNRHGWEGFLENVVAKEMPGYVAPKPVENINSGQVTMTTNANFFTGSTGLTSF